MSSNDFIKLKGEPSFLFVEESTYARPKVFFLSFAFCQFMNDVRSFFISTNEFYHGKEPINFIFRPMKNFQRKVDRKRKSNRKEKRSSTRSIEVHRCDKFDSIEIDLKFIDNRRSMMNEWFSINKDSISRSTNMKNTIFFIDDPNVIFVDPTKNSHLYLA